MITLTSDSPISFEKKIAAYLVWLTICWNDLFEKIQFLKSSKQKISEDLELMSMIYESLMRTENEKDKANMLLAYIMQENVMKRLMKEYAEFIKKLQEAHEKLHVEIQGLYRQMYADIEVRNNRFIQIVNAFDELAVNGMFEISIGINVIRIRIDEIKNVYINRHEYDLRQIAEGGEVDIDQSKREINRNLKDIILSAALNQGVDNLKDQKEIDLRIGRLLDKADNTGIHDAFVNDIDATKQARKEINSKEINVNRLKDTINDLRNNPPEIFKIASGLFNSSSANISIMLNSMQPVSNKVNIPAQPGKQEEQVANQENIMRHENKKPEENKKDDDLDEELFISLLKKR